MCPGCVSLASNFAFVFCFIPIIFIHTFCLLFNLYWHIFVDKVDQQIGIETESYRDLPSTGSSVTCLLYTQFKPRVRNDSQVPTWVAGTQCVCRDLLPPAASIHGKLEWNQRKDPAMFNPTYSDAGCRGLKTGFSPPSHTPQASR